MKKDMVYTVIDTYSTPSYEDYVEDCKERGVEPESEFSDDYLQWIGDVVDENYECDLSNLRYSEDMDKPCIITGTLGLWDGTKTIWATRCDNIIKAIKKCYGSCDAIIVKFNNGVYECQALHHDGRNCFEIRKLTKNGIKAVNKWYENSNNVEVKPSWVCKFRGY